jgi:6,7-dimethyl-8-ribityllumazine synthase
MSKIIQGILDGKGFKFGIILPRFNDFIGQKLLEGAVDGLVRNGVSDNDISIFRVPGAFEIPFVANKLVHLDKFDAIICLGAVLRGATPHFEYISAEVTKGIAQVNMESKIPVIYGVLTCDTIEQAIERAGTKSGNKGYDAAISAIEMINLIKLIG